MTDPGAVRVALRALATGAAPDAAPVRDDDRTPPASPRRVVARAAEAFEAVREAAAFLEGGGEARLRRAVSAAERRGDVATARTGQRLLATLGRYRRVLRPGRDHFHPAHGTVLSADGQPRSE